MPLRDKGFVSLQIRYFKPAVDTDFALSGHIAAVLRHEVAKAGPVILAAEREEPAEAGTEGMDPAAAVFSEECTTYIVSTHEQVGQHQALIDMESDADAHKIRKAFFKVPAKHENIVRIQMDRIIHSAAALAAAVAGAAGNPGHVARRQKFMHGNPFFL